MKVLLGLVTALSVLCGTALAADMRVPSPAPVPVAIPFSWSGFYAGSVIGFGSASVDNTVGGIGGMSSNPTGFIGGGVVGYNWQFSNRFVLGVEADIIGSSLADTETLNGKVGTVPFETQVTNRLNWLGTVRGRLGYVLLPRLMIYGTGGLAYGGFTDNIRSCFGCSSLNSNFTTAFTGSNSRSGWAAGAGFEYAVTDHALARLEYVHYDLGSVTWADGNVVTDHRGDLFRAGLLWKF